MTPNRQRRTRWFGVFCDLGSLIAREDHVFTEVGLDEATRSQLGSTLASIHPFSLGDLEALRAELAEVRRRSAGVRLMVVVPSPRDAGGKPRPPSWRLEEACDRVGALLVEDRGGVTRG